MSELSEKFKKLHQTVSPYKQKLQKSLWVKIRRLRSEIF